MPDDDDMIDTGSTPRGKASVRRQRVIDAAASTFSRFGYHGVGTRTIAESLGIKVASLYFHVTSKEEALEEVCRRGIEQPLQFIRCALSDATDLASRIRFFFRRQREELAEHGDYISVYIHERRHLPPLALARLDMISREFRAEMDRMFREAAERDELHPTLTPRIASLVMIGTVRNISQFYTDGPIKNFDEFASGAIEALIRGVVSTGDADRRRRSLRRRAQQDNL